MKIKNLNKYFVFTSFIILVLCIIPSINADTNKSNFLGASSNKINIFKIDSNGQISAINVVITQEEENNIDSAIKQKLDVLCKNDKEIQQFVNKNSVVPWVEIESKGCGFHRSFRRIFWSNRTIIWRSFIKYRYYNDSDYTKARFKGDDEWMTITGSQHIRLVGFIGYVSCKSNIFHSRFNIHNITINGYTLRIDILK